ncbi:hypothetical protein ACS8GA_002961 [Enterococcus hirae]
MSSHDPRPLLNEILSFLKENQIVDTLKDINKSIENLKKNDDEEETVYKFKKTVKKFWYNDFSIVLSILSLLIGFYSLNATLSIHSVTQKINNDNNPLEYSISLKKTILKINTNYPEKNYFNDLYLSYNLKRNDGGKVKELYLLKFNNNENIEIISPIINNTFNNDLTKNTEPSSSQKEKIKFDTSKNKIIWNKKEKNLYIYDSELLMSSTTDTVSIFFLLLLGNNNSTEIITVLQKLGANKENYKDTTVTFSNLDIFDFEKWKQQTMKANITNFEKIYENTISKYQKVVRFTKNNLL